MKVGMILPRIGPKGQAIRRTTFLEAIERVERVGFDSAWLTDSIGRGFANPDPLTALSVAAARTTRIRLGVSILQVPIRNPVELAHRVMTCHFMSGDRLWLGVGAGSARADFEATDSDFQGRFVRFAASLDVVRRLLHGETVDGVALTPFEETLGGPPILIGSWGGSRWIKRAAQEFDGWIGSARKTNWETIELGLRRYRGAGGKRAVMTNLVIDPAVPDGPRDDATSALGPCGLSRGRERLRRLRDLGFDDVVLRTSDHTDEAIGHIVDVVETCVRQ